MLARPKIKVVNLLNQNEGLLQDYQITWSVVNGAEGYLIFKSYVPYGTYEKVGQVEAGVTSFIDDTSTILAETSTMFRDLAAMTANTLIIPYYKVCGYTIDEDGEMELGDMSYPSSQEEAKITCSSSSGSSYIINGEVVNHCKSGTPLPTQSETTDLFLQIRERTEQILMNDGQDVWYFKPLIQGERCPYVQDDTHECQYGTKCEVCYGTGLVGGYYPPLKIRVVLTQTQKEHKLESTGIREVHEPKMWTIWTPRITDRDFIVANDGRRYLLSNVMITSPFRNGAITRQDAQIRELEPTHILYKLNVPGPLL